MKKTLITAVTDGQKKQIKRFVENAVNRAIIKGLLDKDGIQKLIENGDEFQAHIITDIKKLSVFNQFVNEEVESSYAYPKGYKVKGITEQVVILKSLFPELENATFDEKIAEQPLPVNAEGWFAIPRWEMIEKVYHEAIDRVLIAIGQKREFSNHSLVTHFMRQRPKTAKAFQKLGNKQKNHNILVVPCQFGLRHRGRSNRRVCEVLQINEFCLDVFANGTMLLTHSEREAEWEQLHIDCAGNVITNTNWSPYFSTDGEELWFDVGLENATNDHYGSPTGFLF